MRRLQLIQNRNALVVVLLYNKSHTEVRALEGYAQIRPL